MYEYMTSKYCCHVLTNNMSDTYRLLCNERFYYEHSFDDESIQ